MPKQKANSEQCIPSKHLLFTEKVSLTLGSSENAESIQRPVDARFN